MEADSLPHLAAFFSWRLLDYKADGRRFRIDISARQCVVGINIAPRRMYIPSQSCAHEGRMLGARAIRSHVQVDGATVMMSRG
jgi:hypothetical protein